eukprot:3543521-Prymnesium_polylepis.1
MWPAASLRALALRGSAALAGLTSASRTQPASTAAPYVGRFAPAAAPPQTQYSRPREATPANRPRGPGRPVRRLPCTQAAGAPQTSPHAPPKAAATETSAARRCSRPV